MTLKIAPTLTLPNEAVTRTFAVLAMRGVGKTYTAAKLIEEMAKAHLPVCVIDPIGVWWGLRSNRDGNGPGLPVVILGGDHADVPLDVNGGAVVADFVVEQRQPCVIDLSLFRKGEQTTFMTAFCERLYHKNREALHLVIDEADAYAPQRAMHGSERLLGAVEDLVRRGRARGIGVTLITQRAAVLNKNVLTQADVLVALRTVAPQDRAAIDEWIKVHGTPEQRETMMKSLASLPVGTAWFWSPGWLDIFERVAVARRETFDSSATPKVGVKIAAPKALAPVDLDALRERMAATIEKAKADDPRELRRQIDALKRQVRELEARPAPIETRTVEVPVIPESVRLGVENLRDALVTLGNHVSHGVATQVDRIDGILSVIGSIDDVSHEVHSEQTPATVSAAPKPVAPRPASRPSAVKLPKAERCILTVLAQFLGGRTKSQIAIMTGYAGSGGGFNNAVSALRSAGYVVGASSGVLQATDAGIAALGEYEPIPTGGRELLEHWKRHPSLGKAERSILDVLHEARSPMPKEEIAARAGYEATGGGFNNAMSRLKTLELINRDGSGFTIAQELSR